MRFPLASISFVTVFAFAAKAFAFGDPPAYSPLPPPPPPPPDLAARPAPPPDSAARPAPRPPPSAPKPNATIARADAVTAPVETTSASPASPAPARIEEPSPRERVRPALDDERLSVSPLLGFGTNKLELGVGLRAGAIAIAPHLWIGGTFIYHNGTSTEGAVANVRYAASSSLIYMGPEVGYDFEAGPLLIRPFGGIGPGFFHVSSTSANVSTSDTTTRFLLWMGGAVLYGIPNSRFFVGGDMRLVTVPLGPAFGMYALGGMTF